jgi:hypothetical protein
VVGGRVYFYRPMRFARGIFAGGMVLWMISCCVLPV